MDSGCRRKFSGACGLVNGDAIGVKIIDLQHETLSQIEIDATDGGRRNDLFDLHNDRNMVRSLAVSLSILTSFLCIDHSLTR